MYTNWYPQKNRSNSPSPDVVNRRSRLEEEEEEEEEEEVVIALFLLARQRTAKVRERGGEGIRGFYGFQAERTHRS